jgi:hypothetical protein
MLGMRFQFSILTMLVCTAALAGVTAACVSIPMPDEFGVILNQDMTVGPGGELIFSGGYASVGEPPTGEQIIWRMAWAGPLAVLVSLCLLRASRWIVKRFKTE